VVELGFHFFRRPMSRRDLCPIFQDNTERLFKRLLNDDTHGAFVRQAITTSTLHDGDALAKIPSAAARHARPQVNVVNLDSLECARLIIQKHGDKRPLVHNMASDIKPGGGVIHGAKAQEESLARRSLLYMSLDHYYRATFGAKQKSASEQPKKIVNWYNRGLGEMELSYNPDVLVVRDVNNEEMSESEWFAVSFVSSAAIRRPDVDASGKYMSDDRDAQLMRDKYKALLRLAWQQGHRNLVLSAWGSGAFRVPCQHVADILMDLLFVDKEFVGAFDNIYIAIIDPYLRTANYATYKQAVDTATAQFDKTNAFSASHGEHSHNAAATAAAAAPAAACASVVSSYASTSSTSPTLDVRNQAAASGTIAPHVASSGPEAATVVGAASKPHMTKNERRRERKNKLKMHLQNAL
jgi:uncharacterized protein (TIGR02452 family)